MNIQQLNMFQTPYKNQYNTQKKVVSNPSFTASILFKYPNYRQLEKFPEYLYRAVDKDEYLKIVNKIPIGGQKFCSINPMGWLAEEWGRGFHHDVPDIFFITFKKNNFKQSMISQQDSPDFIKSKSIWNNVRFMIKREPKIDDVECIREGNNARGKIVWASSPEIIEQDRQEKINRIFHLLKTLSNHNKDIMYKNEELEELSCLVKEYPNIIDTILQHKNFGLSDYDIEYLIYRSENKKFYPYIRKHLEEFADKKRELSTYAMHYIETNGTNKDLDLILKALKNNPTGGKHFLNYHYAITELMEDKDIPKILDIGFKGSPYIRYEILNILLTDQEKYHKEILQLSRRILKDYTNIANWNDGREQLEIIDCLCEIDPIMRIYGEKSDIELLKPYTKSHKAYQFTDTIKAIKQRLNIEKQTAGDVHAI